MLACAEESVGPTAGTLRILAAAIPADTVGAIGVAPGRVYGSLSGDRLVVVHSAQPDRLPDFFALSILDLNGNITPLTQGNPSE